MFLVFELFLARGLNVRKRKRKTYTITTTILYVVYWALQVMSSKSKQLQMFKRIRLKPIRLPQYTRVSERMRYHFGRYSGAKIKSPRILSSRVTA